MSAVMPAGRSATRARPAIFRGAIAALATLVLAGCVGLRNGDEPERIYVLNPAAAAPAAPSAQGLLMISRPAVQPGLDTARIALKRADNELDYYAGSRWSGALPHMLGAFAVQSMQGAFATVTGEGRGAGPADYELLLTARHFEAVYDQEDSAPEVHVAFECLLVARTPRQVLGSCDADVREPAGGNRMSAIVAAFENASRRALVEVRERAIAAASAAGPSRAATADQTSGGTAAAGRR